MEQKMYSLFEKARKLHVVDSGSQLIFADFIKECDNEIRKQDQQIQRCLGRIDQLKLVRAMVSQVVSKYCQLQEDHNKHLAEAEKRRPVKTIKKGKSKK